MKFRRESLCTGLCSVACAVGTNKCTDEANGIAGFSDPEEVTHEKLLSVQLD